MTEEVVKKKRGRPPKQKTTDMENKNEKKEQIKMSQETVVTSDVTIGQIQSAWASTMQKYGGTVDHSVMKQAVSNAMLSNPFIQNQRVKSINSTASNKDKKAIQTALQNLLDYRRRCCNEVAKVVFPLLPDVRGFRT